MEGAGTTGGGRPREEGGREEEGRGEGGWEEEGWEEEAEGRRGSVEEDGGRGIKEEGTEDWDILNQGVC